MRFVLSAFALLFLVFPAAAQEEPHCEELWLARNLLFDRAGYCFSTPLGQAVFDNSNCTETPAALDTRAADTVARIRAEEAVRGCAVDTDIAALPPYLADELAMYRAVRDIPIRNRSSGGCIGYRGPTILLRSAVEATSAVTGRFAEGASLGFSYASNDGWTFVTVLQPSGELLEFGWAVIAIPDLNCDVYPS